MNLCFVCNEYPLPSTKCYGGIGTFTKTLARGLSERGHTIFVVGYDHEVQKTSWANDEGVQILRLAKPFRNWPNLKVSRYSIGPQVVLERLYLSQRVAEVAKQYSVQLVESHDWAGPLWFSPHHPLVVRMHGANTACSYSEGKQQSRLLRFFERRNVRLADYLVAVSQHIGQITLTALKVADRQFTTIYNAVDTSVFRPIAGVRDPLQVIFVGKSHPRKGIYELLRVWPRVLKEVPGARLVLVGAERTVQINSVMSGWSSGDSNSVEFAGRVAHRELPVWYSESAVAVFPSHAEAFGLTCAEAMACGAAVVMTKLASGPEVVEDNRSGLLVDPTNPEDIAGAIIRLLQDRELAHRLGENARQRVAQFFSQDVILDQNISLYEHLIS